jgi:flagellar biosynthesis protein FlhA
MPSQSLANSEVAKFIERNRGILPPTGAMSLILVILIPLPTVLMDLLLVVNITLATIVLLTVMYTDKPLRFSSFPSLLLALTLYRLVLNTATTRLILTNATDGTAAAGQVIQTFGGFVAGGSLAVGVIIFVIIIVIQFVVITKGATRIAEVAARFTLDGMPGKQMAVDADLNAGLISEEEAKARRKEITQEADFYGAMDGASKFVRGDAVAGIVITFVNILGGIYVGMVALEPPLSFFDTLQIFTMLTIGDGLASQIPAFIISVAAAMIVTRSTAQADFGEEIFGQLTAQPVALALAAIFLGMLALTPLPKVPLGLLGIGCGGLALTLTRSRSAAAVKISEAKKKAEKVPDKPETNLPIDPMELEVGYGLIRLVDRKQSGDLLDRISMIRRQTALDLGIIVPPIRIRDNVQLPANRYAVKLRGIEIASGEILPGHLMAIDSGVVSEPVQGIETSEPAFGLPALWISTEHRQSAEHRNYTVVEPTAVLATHLTEVIKEHADDLLTREEVNRLLDHLRERAAKLVDEVVPELLKPAQIQKVLQALLRERVSIRDLETVLEALGDWAPRTKDLEVLTEYARNALARNISQQYKTAEGKIPCVTLDPSLEDLVNSHIERSERGNLLTLPVETQNRFVDAVRRQIESATPNAGGQTPVILCSPAVRMWVRRLIESAMPQVPVLGYNEVVRGIEVQSLGMVVLADEVANVSG